MCRIGLVVVVSSVRMQKGIHGVLVWYKCERYDGRPVVFWTRATMASPGPITVGARARERLLCRKATKVSLFIMAMADLEAKQGTGQSGEE